MQKEEVRNAVRIHCRHGNLWLFRGFSHHISVNVASKIQLFPNMKDNISLFLDGTFADNPNTNL